MVIKIITVDSHLMLTQFLFIMKMSQCFKCCCYGFEFLFYVEYLVFVCHYVSILNVRLGDISGWYYFEYELHYWLCGYHSGVSAYGQAGCDNAEELTFVTACCNTQKLPGFFVMKEGVQIVCCALCFRYVQLSKIKDWNHV